MGIYLIGILITILLAIILSPNKSLWRLLFFDLRAIDGIAILMMGIGWPLFIIYSTVIFVIHLLNKLIQIRGKY